MLSAYIVEDEPQAIALLRTHIEKVHWLSCCGVSRQPHQAIEYLNTHEVDVLFLDINLPLLSGIEMLDKIAPRPPIIFTTAYTDYASTAFDVDAVDYLVKPITYDRFSRACDKLLKVVDEPTVTPSHKEPAADLLYIKSGSTTYQLSWQAIQYIMRDENYICLYLPDKKLLVRRSLSSLESAFPSYFVRVHKSYAISLLHTTEIKAQALTVAGTTIPIGRSYRATLRQKLGQI